METLFDYLIKTKNIDLEHSSLNEIDIAIFCILSYLPWDYIVAPPYKNKEIFLMEAIQKFNNWNYSSPFRMWKDQQLIDLMKQSNRYQTVTMSNYVNHYDSKSETQFSALSFHLPNNQSVIAFRGTDDTLVGWKEDFNMSFEYPIKAQEEALEYLNHILPTRNEDIIIAGHSKGGNLAIYSSVFTTPENKIKIKSIYNFDGPGFLEQITSTKEYQSMAQQMITLVPESSIVGMLLEQTETYTIIKSYQLGILQHSLYSWVISGNQFIKLKKITKNSMYINQTLKEWIHSLTKKEREQLIDSLYQIFEKTGATTIQELTSNWVQNSRIIIEQLHDMDETTKQFLLQTMIELFKISKKNLTLYLNND